MDMGSLYAFLHSAEKIDINMTIAYVKGIASGMHHLQSEGIVYVFNSSSLSQSVLISIV